MAGPITPSAAIPPGRFSIALFLLLVVATRTYAEYATELLLSYG
jgi:hypothetical protein